MPASLFGQGFAGYEVSTIENAGFKGLENGELLADAGESYDVLITVDRGIEYQQNLKTLPIAILLLKSRSNRLDHLQELIPVALDALRIISPGEFITISR